MTYDDLRYIEALKECYSGIPSEGDIDTVNAGTHRHLAAFAEKHGQVWLGHINLRPGQTADLWQYDGHVYNFGADFAVPANDPALVALIRERAEAEYTGTAADSVRVKAIINKIAELGGINLMWA